eukprot:6336767-Prorocentrum_lima.AAC.1
MARSRRAFEAHCPNFNDDADFSAHERSFRRRYLRFPSPPVQVGHASPVAGECWLRQGMLMTWRDAPHAVLQG